jgi:hypothetical protein
MRAINALAGLLDIKAVAAGVEFLLQVADRYRRIAVRLFAGLSAFKHAETGLDSISGRMHLPRVSRSAHVLFCGADVLITG